MAKLKINQLLKNYGKTEVLKNINIDIEHGEFVVLVGPSGCGKSTLLRTIAGLEDVTDGEIQIDDLKVNEVDPSDRGVAMVFQSYALYPHMNVAQNMGFGLRMSKVPKAEIEKKVNEAAQVLKIEHLLQRKPKQLSGGQRQRVAIGRAIVREPKAFLFDEPLSNLDAELRVQMRIELMKLHERLKSTMIYVTHDQVEAMTMANKIVVLRDGIVEQIGSPDDVYAKPANLFVASFIGSPKMNFFEATIGKQAKDQTEILFQDKSMPTLKIKDKKFSKLKEGAKLTMGLRPEHMHLEKEKNDEVMNLTTEISEILGSTTHVHCKSHEKSDIVFEVRGNPHLENHKSVKIYFDSNSLYWFNEEGSKI